MRYIDDNMLKTFTDDIILHILKECGIEVREDSTSSFEDFIKQKLQDLKNQSMDNDGDDLLEEEQDGVN